MMKSLLTKLSTATLILVFVSTSLFALTGCNTTAGVGKDMEAAGEAIHDKADEEKKY